MAHYRLMSKAAIERLTVTVLARSWEIVLAEGILAQSSDENTNLYGWPETKIRDSVTTL